MAVFEVLLGADSGGGGARGACAPSSATCKVASHSSQYTVLTLPDHNCLYTIIINGQLGGINKCLWSFGPLETMRGGFSIMQLTTTLPSNPAWKSFIQCTKLTRILIKIQF